MTDQVANFIEGTVSTGYDESAITIILNSGHNFPDPSGDNYNVVWYDSTNFPNPALDPKVEIDRVTALSTNTITITRAQGGTLASTKNTSGATYKMILTPTAKTISDLKADTTFIGAALTIHMSDTSTHGVTEIANVATVSAEIDSDITTHAALGDAHHNESHTVISHSDTTATGIELETLTDGSDADSLHAHAVNDAKVTNATHTGDVTGDSALTIGADKVNDTHIDWGTGVNQVSAVDIPIADTGVIITATEIEGALQENRTAINLNTAKDTNVSTDLSEGTSTETTVDVNSSDGTNATLVAASALRAGLLTKAKFDEIVANNAKVTNATHTGDVTGSEALTITVDAVDIPMFSATGTADGTTFLRGDNTWSTPAGSGDVSKVGTPVDNQIGVWTGDGTIEGTSGLTYNGTALDVSGDVNIAATKHLVLPLHNDAVTPTLTFGDGDTGFYESSDDNIGISISGAQKWKIDTLYMGSILSGGARLVSAGASSTVPTLVPNNWDGDNGIGSAGTDSISLIAGGVEGLRITEVTGTITNAFTDNITVTGTVDGRDINTDGTKLDTIDTNADVTADNAPQTHAMSTHTDEGALATLSTVDTAQIDADAVTYDKMQDTSATNKLLGRSTAGAGTIEEIACTAAGRALLDDADAATQRTTLDVDQAGTDNSTDVTLAGTPDYITISGQIITRNQVDLTADVTGNLPIGNLNSGTDASSSTFWRGDGTWVAPAGSGDMVLADIQTVTGAKTFGTIGGAVSKFILAGSTSGSSILNAAAAAGSTTLTLPAATDTLVGKATTDTFTNKTFDANGTGNSLSNVDIADLANGTDGELITWDAAGVPDTVAVGTATHVLTSNGVGVAPTFQAAAGGSQTVNIFLSSEAAYLPATNPVQLVEELGTTVYGGYSTANFDDTTAEHIIFRCPVPDYDGNNITFKFYWIATATSGNVIWTIESIGITDGEEILEAVVTDLVDVTADTVTGTTLDLNVTTHSTYNPASVTADDLMIIEITRKAGTDTMTGDARLLGILIEYTRA